MKTLASLVLCTISVAGLSVAAAHADSFSSVTTSTDDVQPITETRTTTTEEIAPSTTTVVKEQPVIVQPAAPETVVVKKKNSHHLLNLGLIKVF